MRVGTTTGKYKPISAINGPYAHKSSLKLLANNWPWLPGACGSPIIMLSLDSTNKMIFAKDIRLVRWGSVHGRIFSRGNQSQENRLKSTGGPEG
mgnify:FL=1|jgi:hypothetical protein